MVELRGLEPLTSSMPLRRSPKLSYSPDRRGMVAERRPARQGRRALRPGMSAGATQSGRVTRLLCEEVEELREGAGESGHDEDRRDPHHVVHRRIPFPQNGRQEGPRH